MLRILLGLVAVTFISWGGYSLIREKKVTYAAKVNGVEIQMKDYSDAYQGMIKQYRDALRESFSEKMIEDLGLRGKVLEDLISKVLILKEGARMGLDVQDEELRRNIESIPSFQINGQFDPRIYERFLRLNRMSPEQFEQMQRENLLISRVVNFIRLNGGKVSEEEVLETYLFENERINLAPS
jgi:peptidyl-prolyl cis-trans isomerase D